MISVKSHRRLGVYIATAGVLAVAVIGLFVFIPKTYAAGGVGSGGNPGNSTGTYHTDNGFGWRKYNVTSRTAPTQVGAMTNGTWDDVYNACKDVGQVWMFMIFNSGQSVGKQYAMNANGGGIIYLEPKPGTWDGRYYKTYFEPQRKTNGSYYRSHYIGNASENTVHGYFDTAVRTGIISPGSLRYGTSIGWFCYSDNPPWAISIATTVDKTVAEPGERITWSHTLKNEGANTTNRAITWRYKSQGSISDTGPNWTWGSGQANGVTSPAQTSTYDVGTNDVGRTFCRSASAEPSTNITTSPTIESTSVCVLVAKKPKVQIWGGDLMVGRPFSGTAALAGTTTSITNKIPPAAVIPPYNTSMITGLWQTGVDSGGNKLAPGSGDPHWQLTNVYRANANGSTLTPATNDTHWTSTNNQDTCQPGPYPRAATVVNTALVTVGGNDAWKTTLPSAAWIGGNVAANNIGNSGSCTYPGMSATIDQATFAKASIWVFRLTNGFNIDSCVDPATVRLNLNLSADDEVQVLVNGQTVAEPGNFRHYNNWPSTPVSYTTNTSSAFRNGSNSLEIRLKSAWQYTGMIVNSLSVAQAQCRPVTSGNVFGSWVEYGIFATGVINGTGSGSAFAGTGGRSDSKCTYSTLSFVNAGAAPTGTSLPSTACTNSTPVGQYSTAKNLPNIGANFPFSQDTAVYANSGSSQGVYRSDNLDTSQVASPITISAKTLQKGQWVVVNAPNADVTITGNIDYTNALLQSVSDIPQMVIIARNIYITDSVTNIDAWLIAKGTTNGTGVLDTCYGASRPAFTSPLTVSMCDRELRVNGPVMAKALWLRRTAGAGASGAAPAEIFNLRPDAYLWLNARASTSGRIQIVDIKELPPRF